MYVVLNSLYNDFAIVSISSNRDKIALLDVYNTLHVYDKESLKLQHKKRLVKITEPKHLYHKGSSLSSEMDIFLSSQESGSAILVHLEKSPILREKFAYNKRAIYYSLFNHDSTMLAFGGEDGRFYTYDLCSGDISSIVSVQSDYISAISFSFTKRFIAISSFNKKTIIYDTLKHQKIAVLELAVATEVSSFNYDDRYLLLLNRSEKVCKYVIETQELIESSFELEGWATAIVMLENEYCVIGTRSNKLYLMNHNTFRIVGTIEFEKSGITQVHKDESLLIVSFIDGEVLVVDMYAYLDEFTMHLSLHEFQRAHSYLEYNLFLHTSQSIKIFDTEWQRVLEEAQGLLAKNEQSQANNLVSPFMFDEKKKDEYECCKLNSPIYERFINYIHAFRYSDAYNLVELREEYGFLKSTKEYKRLEREWLFVYKEAKSMLMKDNEEIHDEAKRKLLPFIRAHSKKVIILELLDNYKIFKLSDNYVRTRDFKAYFELVAQHKFLQLEEVYKKVIEIGQSTYKRLIDFEQNLKLNEAIEIATFLLDFKPMYEVIAPTLERLKQKKELEGHCKNKNIKEVYAYIQKNPQLENSKIFEEFHEGFLIKVDEIKLLSQNGEVYKIIETVREYLDLPYTREALAYHFRKAYIREILLAYESEDAYLINFEQTITQFYSFFGRHSDIFTSFQNAQISQSVLLLDELKEYSADGYMSQKFLGTILKKF